MWNVFVPRRGCPDSEAVELVLAPDVYWAFLFLPFMWVCMSPYMPINVSIFPLVSNCLCGFTLSPPSWIFIRSSLWSLGVARDLQLCNPNPVRSELQKVCNDISVQDISVFWNDYFCLFIQIKIHIQALISMHIYKKSSLRCSEILTFF